MKNHQTGDGIDNTINLFLRKMIVAYLIFMLIICSVFTILYAVNDATVVKSFLFLISIQHIIWLVGFLYYKDISIETCVIVYISYALVSMIYPVGCIFWNSGSPVVFFWYLIILFGAMAFHLRNMLLWIFLTLAVVISIFFFSPIFPQCDFAPFLIKEVNIITVISTIILISFLAIVYTKNTNIQESLRTQKLEIDIKDAENLERDKNLYNDIIEYLENNKPFKNPDFNAQELAKALNTNVNYISKALNAGGNGDFRTMLNSFRINCAKSMLDNGAMKKFTIDYIYTEVGYKHRSTFNAAFKLITGVTPSDYVSQQNIDNNSEL